jgi:hypothetical protein
MSPYLLGYPIRRLALAAPIVIAANGLVQAACYNSRQQLPAKTLTQFIADQGQLQSKYPNGGARMISFVRDLVASDPNMLPRVLDQSANSNADQVNAIGAGLGQAALVCSRGDPTFANEIRQMVAAINNQPLALTFAAVVGNSPAAAGSGNRNLSSGADTSGPPSTNGNDRGASPADTVTGQPGNPFFTAPPGSLRTASPTNAGTTATQGVTSAVGVPTGATTTGTGSTGVAGSAGSTTAGTGATGTTSVPGALAMTSTEQTATGTIDSPALTIEGGVATGLTGPTSAPEAPSSTSPTTPTTAITPTGTTATGASTTGLSVLTGAGGSGTPSQAAPTGFFTFDFNAKSEPVGGGTKKASARRSVSPSQ